MYTGHMMITCLCGPHGNKWECTGVWDFVSIRPLPNVQISHVLRDVKHISQSQE